MFTQRFIKLPIKLFNQEHFDLTGEEITQDSYIMINPITIGAYRPSFENEGSAVHINFKDGGTILVYLDIKLFEEIINKHQQ